MSTNLVRKMLAGMVAMLAGASVQAATIPVSPGTGNIAAAIVAASNGDILELQDGVFHEGQLNIAKSLTFAAATGANPVLTFSNTGITPGTANFVMDITVGGVIFDGVDIVLDGNDPTAPGTIRGIVIRGAATTLANAATFRNLSVTDTPNGPVAGYWVFAAETNLILDNVDITIDNNLPQVPVGLMGTGQNLQITNSRLSIASGNGVIYLEGNGKTLNISRSKVTGQGIHSSAATTPVINATNCLFTYNASAQPRSAFLSDSGGQVTIRHCTFTDVNSTTFTRPIRYSDNSAHGAVGHLTVQNCIFNVPTNPAARPQAIIWENVAAPATNLTYTIGTNLTRGAVVATPDDDKVTLGTVVVGNPNLVDDVNLGDPSPALGAGVDVGVTNDINGNIRSNPVASPPDLGASESYLVPVEISGFTID